MAMSKRDFIEVDKRGRTSLARVRTRAYDRYHAEEFEDGTIVLSPLVTLPAGALRTVQEPADD